MTKDRLHTNVYHIWLNIYLSNYHVCSHPLADRSSFCSWSSGDFDEQSSHNNLINQ